MQELMQDKRYKQDFKEDKGNIPYKVYKNMVEIPEDQIVYKINGCWKDDQDQSKYDLPAKK